MNEFFKDIGIEFKKVTWPTDKEMKTYTTQVFVFMAIMILFFGAVDGVIARGVSHANPSPIVEEYDGYDDADDDSEGETGSEETSEDQEATE